MATRMSDEAAQKVERRFRRVERELQGTRNELKGTKAALEQGAGEFGQIIEGEARHFQNSWRAVLEVYADSAAVIAENTNAQHLDLLNIDAGSS